MSALGATEHEQDEGRTGKLFEHWVATTAFGMPVQGLGISFSAALPLGGLFQFLIPYMMPCCKVNTRFRPRWSSISQCMRLSLLHASSQLLVAPNSRAAECSITCKSQGRTHGWKRRR